MSMHLQERINDAMTEREALAELADWAHNNPWINVASIPRTVRDSLPLPIRYRILKMQDPNVTVDRMYTYAVEIDDALAETGKEA